MTTTPKLELRQQGAIALLTINRPEVLNAIDADVCDALIATVAALEAGDATKVLVVTGAGERAFSSGADLTHVRTLSGSSLRRYLEKTWQAFDAVARAPFISIAALHGHVLGGGAELALAADIRLAANNLSFGFPEMTLGSLPGSGGVQRLPLVVGQAKALELITLGTRLGAAEAASLRLVNHVVGKGEALGAALAMADEIAKRPAESLRYAKIAIRMGDDHRIAGAMHGLVSSVRQADPSYRANTSAFDKDSKA
ncbi:MAG: enoyl-CoA hydratase/isomerase family protein [Hyphomicrobiales bacterium]|nr:MAG: enoyl-CoA hydratase/isomerase family protein [Hyphomicrobiales bacterium]